MRRKSRGWLNERKELYLNQFYHAQRITGGIAMIEATSCGGVVIFRGKILLLYKSYKNKYEGWVLPKGTVEAVKSIRTQQRGRCWRRQAFTRRSLNMLARASIHLTCRKTRCLRMYTGTSWCQTAITANHNVKNILWIRAIISFMKPITCWNFPTRNRYWNVHIMSIWTWKRGISGEADNIFKRRSCCTGS